MKSVNSVYALYDCKRCRRKFTGGYGIDVEPNKGAYLQATSMIQNVADKDAPAEGVPLIRDHVCHDGGGIGLATFIGISYTPVE